VSEGKGSSEKENEKRASLFFTCVVPCALKAEGKKKHQKGDSPFLVVNHGAP
jgi:hypothetical protein